MRVRAVIMELLKTPMRLGGIIATLLGAVFTLAGAYGLAGETRISSIIGETTLSAQEGGLIFSVVGITVLVGGQS
ncbi:MAG: hypothetical protein JSV29_01560 [Candidatus Bathyarchaeota archaeon]|nr:MAG: hypothetical protein JSV29_01560 [Candidatus Bathyarchaeota archaeon]